MLDLKEKLAVVAATEKVLAEQPLPVDDQNVLEQLCSVHQVPYFIYKNYSSVLYKKCRSFHSCFIKYRNEFLCCCLGSEKETGAPFFSSGRRFRALSGGARKQ